MIYRSQRLDSVAKLQYILMNVLGGTCILAALVPLPSALKIAAVSITFGITAGLWGLAPDHPGVAEERPRGGGRMSEQHELEIDAPANPEARPPKLGASVLTVGLVTIAFGSVFSLVGQGPVAVLLLAVVSLVAIVSGVAGFYSDSELLFPPGVTATRISGQASSVFAGPPCRHCRTHRFHHRHPAAPRLLETGI